MTVQEFLDKNKPEKYLIADRMRVKISDELLKYIDLADVEIRNVDTLPDGTVRIHSDYMPDGC